MKSTLQNHRMLNFFWNLAHLSIATHQVHPQAGLHNQTNELTFVRSFQSVPIADTSELLPFFFLMCTLPGIFPYRFIAMKAIR